MILCFWECNTPPRFKVCLNPISKTFKRSVLNLFQEDHASGQITPREFQRRLAFCSRKLNEARKCLNDGFSPADGCPEKPDSPGTESLRRRLERRAKQKIWHFILCRSQLMDPNRVRFESFVNVNREEDWTKKKRNKKIMHHLCWI